MSLPTTNFSQRAHAAVREPELQAFWGREKIYEDLAKNNPGDAFVLHDGPPYANGDVRTFFSLSTQRWRHD